jgi:hypothetical protein
MDRRYMVQQYVAVVQNRRGQRFRVYKTGDERYYLFDPLVPGTDCSGCVAFPVRKSDLITPIRRALAHGWGNA